MTIYIEDKLNDNQGKFLAAIAVACAREVENETDGRDIALASIANAAAAMSEIRPDSEVQSLSLDRMREVINGTMTRLEELMAGAR